MAIMGIYPVLQTRDVASTAAWWQHNFDFEVTFEADWYVSMRRDSWELAVLSADHPTVPESHRTAVAGGVIVNVEVDDADAEWRRLVLDGEQLACLPIRSEDFGQRHFIIAAPDGVLVDVIQQIEPSAEFAAAYLSA